MNESKIDAVWPEPIKLSAVVLSCNRVPNLLLHILPELLQHELIGEVLIWHNNKDTLEALKAGVIKEYSSEPVHLMADQAGRNLFTFGRFKAALLATSPLVYTQDDDCWVRGEEINRLAETWLHNAPLTGVACYLDEGHLRLSRNGNYSHTVELPNGEQYIHQTLLGWGSVFRRCAVSVLDDYRSVYGFDDLLLRKADRLFAMLTGLPHAELKSDVRHLPGSRDSDALYRRKDHWRLTADAVDRACRIWRLLHGVGVTSQAGS